MHNRFMFKFIKLTRMLCFFLNFFMLASSPSLSGVIERLKGLTCYRNQVRALTKHWLFELRPFFHFA